MRSFLRVARFGGVKQKLTRWHRKRLRSAAYVDVRIAQLMGILRASGELENTYVFFYSDNGYHMGEHRLPSHTVGGKAFAYTFQPVPARTALDAAHGVCAPMPASLANSWRERPRSPRP